MGTTRGAPRSQAATPTVGAFLGQFLFAALKPFVETVSALFGVLAIEAGVALAFGFFADGNAC
ncbi:MAG: hypothetical protein R2856_27930 [Caldilineaceae bacterium]